MVSRITHLASGACLHPEFVTRRGGSFNSVVFPARVTVIEHPREGIVLFDTGYANHFFEATRRFPEKLYALTTPVKLSPGQSAVDQLKSLGITPSDVRWIVCSHFHGDHIAGLRDFPEAKFAFYEEEYRSFKSYGRIGRLRHGYLQALLPDDFVSRAHSISTEQFLEADHGIAPFNRTHDLFGDGSIVLAPLPGHTRGQIGALVRSSGRDQFLVGDASWSSLAIEKNIPPHPLAYLIMDKGRDYLNSLERLHLLHQNRGDSLEIIPCHCGKKHAGDVFDV